MKKFNTLRCLLTLALVAVLLTGCMGEQMGFVVNPDGTCSFRMAILYSKEYYNAAKDAGGKSSSVDLVESGDFVKEEVQIDGVPHYSYSKELKFKNKEEMIACLTSSSAYLSKMKEGSKKPELYKSDSMQRPFSSIQITDDKCMATIDENMMQDTKESGTSSTSNLYAEYKKYGIFVDISITLPNEIKESNGAIKDKTVSWDFDNMPVDNKLYAFYGEGSLMKEDKEAPTIYGASNGKLYKKKRTIIVQDNLCLKTITVNGKKSSGNHFASVEGKNTILAQDYNGNSKKITFRVDSVAPDIQGVRNGVTCLGRAKIKIYDKGSGVKYAKMNGKKIKKKKFVVKKKGSYRLQVVDKVGNKTKIKFKVI